MVGWEGTGNEPTQADSRLREFIPGKKNKKNYRIVAVNGGSGPVGSRGNVRCSLATETLVRGWRRRKRTARKTNTHTLANSAP